MKTNEKALSRVIGALAGVIVWLLGLAALYLSGVRGTEGHVLLACFCGLAIIVGVAVAIELESFLLDWRRDRLELQGDVLRVLGRCTCTEEGTVSFAGAEEEDPQPREPLRVDCPLSDGQSVRIRWVGEFADLVARLRAQPWCPDVMDLTEIREGVYELHAGPRPASSLVPRTGISAAAG